MNDIPETIAARLRDLQASEAAQLQRRRALEASKENRQAINDALALMGELPVRFVGGCEQ